MHMTAYNMQGAYMQVYYLHILCRISCKKFSMSMLHIVASLQITAVKKASTQRIQ